MSDAALDALTASLALALSKISFDQNIHVLARDVYVFATELAAGLAPVFGGEPVQEPVQEPAPEEAPAPTPEQALETLDQPVPGTEPAK